MSTLYFTDEHEWLSVEGDTQGQLGDLVFVELPEVGTELTKGDDGAVVESVKAASDVYAPASGEVVEGNPAVTADAELVNRSAESEGWLSSELDELLDAAAYQALIG